MHSLIFLKLDIFCNLTSRSCTSIEILAMMLIDLSLSEVVVVSEVVDNMSHCGGPKCVLFGLGISESLLKLLFVVVVLQLLLFLLLLKFSIVCKSFAIIIYFILHASFSDWICSWYNVWEFDNVFSDFTLNCSNSELKIPSAVFCSSIIISFLRVV